MFDQHVFSGVQSCRSPQFRWRHWMSRVKNASVRIVKLEKMFSPSIAVCEQFHQTNKLNVFSTIWPSWLLWKMLKLLLPWFFGSIPGIVSDAKPLPVASYLEDGFPQLRGEQSPWLLATYSTGDPPTTHFIAEPHPTHCCFEPHEIH